MRWKLLLLIFFYSLFFTLGLAVGIGLLSPPKEVDLIFVGAN